tara:strand:- start:467 stop:1114 length:648 start_codon:yes stop_codon:yes gene_type:complete
MKIKSFLGGYDKNFSYLIWCPSTKIASIIDASTEIIDIIEFIKKNQLILDKILITHTHLDHIKYLDDILKQYPKIIVSGYINPVTQLNGNYKGVTHLEIISIGLEIITVLHTPGHYPDSLCFWNKKHNALFTGDTMFVGRTGRTIGSKSNISDLYKSIYNIILPLPNETCIYSGHHYGFKKIITLKENKNLSPFFNCQSKDEFIKVMNNYEKNRR